jgi:hypothetical protein
MLQRRCGPGSVVGIATAYGMDGPGIEFNNDYVVHQPITTAEAKRHFRIQNLRLFVRCRPSYEYEQYEGLVSNSSFCHKCWPDTSGTYSRQMFWNYLTGWNNLQRWCSSPCNAGRQWWKHDCWTCVWWSYCSNNSWSNFRRSLWLPVQERVW